MPKEKINAQLSFQKGDDILVHYYPGNNSAPTQATRYIGKDDKIRLPTGEVATTKITGVPLFESQHFYFPHMEEIEINQGNNLFARILHRFKSIPSYIKHWWNGVTVVNGDKPSEDNNSYKGFVINSNKSSLGQKTDTYEFAKSNHQIGLSPELSHKQRVYFGVSRGAAATFTALADVKMSQNIKLCVLEAPPSSLSGLFKYFGERYFKSRDFGKWVYNNLAPFLLGAQHKTDKASQARGHVDKFPNNIPLLIVSSKIDTTVGHESSIRLALRVAEKRRRAQQNGDVDVAPVYFLQLDNVDHNEYTTYGSPDSLRYQNTFHAICQKHGLPYITEYAEAGKHEMDAASLLAPEYEPFIELQSKFWNIKDPTARSEFRTKANQSLNELKGSSIPKENTLINERVENVMHHAPLFAKKLKHCHPVNLTEGIENAQKSKCKELI